MIDAAELASDDSKTPTTELDHDGLFVRVQKWWLEDRDHCERWHKRAMEEYDFAALEQWSKEDQEAMKSQNRPALTFDRTNVVLDSVAGAEVANRQEVRFIPRTKKDARPNEILTEGARWFRDQCHAEHEESHAFRDAITVGMGWTETRLDYEENPDGDPRIERVDPLCMYWDSAARKANLTDARRIYRLHVDMPIEEARAKFAGFDDVDLDAAWARSDTGEAQPYDASRPRYRAQKPPAEDMEHAAPDYVTIVEVQWTEREPYYRATVRQLVPDPMTGMMAQRVQRLELSEDEHANMEMRAAEEGMQYRAFRQVRKVHYKAFVGAKVLEVGKLFAPPAGSEYQPKGDCKRLGYNCITGKLDRNKGHFFGLMRVMKDPQSYVNKWMSAASHILTTGAKGGILAERGAFEDEIQAEESYARPDAITWLKGGALAGPNGAKIQPKPVGGFPPQFMQMTEFSISSIRDGTGINAEVLGLRSVDQAASLEYQRRQAATTIMAPLFDSLKLYRKLQGEVLLYLIVNYLADGRLIRITGDDQPTYEPFMLPPDFVTYDVIVDDAPTSPNQKEMIWHTLMQMFPVLKGLPIPPAVYLALLDASPLPASVVAEIKQAAQAASQNPEAAAQKQLAMRGGVAEVRQKEAEAAQTEAETAQIMLETQIAAVTPVVPVKSSI